MMKSTEELEAEHEGILQMLEVLLRICERMESREPPAAGLLNIKSMFNFKGDVLGIRREMGRFVYL